MKPCPDMILLCGQNVDSIAGYSAAGAALSSFLEKESFSLLPLEFSFWVMNNEPEKIITALEKFTDDSTLAVGFSTTLLYTTREDSGLADTFWGPGGLKSILQVTDWLRIYRPKIKIIIGGSQVHLHNAPDFFMSDYVVCGQGETPLLAILRHLAFNEQLISQEVANSRVHIVSDKDYPFTTFNETPFRITKYAHVVPASVFTMEFARGCVFKCAYCNYVLTGKSFKEFCRSPEIIAADLRANYLSHQITHYSIMDDTIIDSEEKLETLERVFKMLDFKVTWGGYFRLDLFLKNPEWVSRVAEMGCIGMVFGIETFDKIVGGKIGKGLGGDKIIVTLEHFKKFAPDMKLHGSFIFGLPHESLSSINETSKWMRETDLLTSAYAHPLRIRAEEDGGISKMTDDQDKYGIILGSDGQLVSQHSAFSSFTAIEEYVNLHIKSYFAVKSEYQHNTHIFKIMQHINVILNSGLVSTAAEAEQFLRDKYMHEYYFKANAFLDQLAVSCRHRYYSELMNSNIDFTASPKKHQIFLMKQL